jgi:hypothetical protein
MCHMQERREMHNIKFLHKNLKKRAHLEDCSVGRGRWIGFIWLRTGARGQWRALLNQ